MRNWAFVCCLVLGSAAAQGCGDEPLSGADADVIGADFAVSDVDDDAAPGDADASPTDGGDAVADADVTDGMTDGTDSDGVEDVAVEVADADPGDSDAGANDTADAADEDVAEDTTSPPCTAPVPFAPPGSPTGWKHTSTKLFTVTQGKANHRGQDVVTTADGPQVLIGKFAYGIFDKDLKEEDVEVFVQPDGACGDWVSLGVVETSLDGQYGTQYGIEDDGGRVFFELTGDQRLGVGVHPVRMLVHGDFSMAAFNVYVFEPGTQSVVFDIDGTLTTDDLELVAQLATEVFNGTYVPEFYEGALETTQAWADKGYQIVYLTARPDFLKVMTLDSMILPGFPPGVVHFTDTNTQFISEVAPYKTEFLQRLENQGGVEIVAAYGNADTDIQAYENVGIPKKVTFIIGDNGGMSGTVPLSDYPSNMPWIQQQPDATTPAPQTQSW